VRQISLPGSVDAVEQTTLYAKTAGYLKSISVDIGDHVRTGQVIAEIDVPEMTNEREAATAEVERATANIATAEAELERAHAEVELKKLSYDRLQGIRNEEPDVLPQQDVDEAKAQYSVALAAVKLAESRVKVAQSERSKAQASLARLSTLLEYTKIR